MLQVLIAKLNKAATCDANAHRQIVTPGATLWGGPMNSVSSQDCTWQLECGKHFMHSRCGALLVEKTSAQGVEWGGANLSAEAC